MYTYCDTLNIIVFIRVQTLRDSMEVFNLSQFTSIVVYLLPYNSHVFRLRFTLSVI